MIQNQYPDQKSEKNDYFSNIVNFKKFDGAVPFKINGVYLEKIPESRKKNYWWGNAVRPIDEETYIKILSHVNHVSEYFYDLPDIESNIAYDFKGPAIEGKKQKKETIVFKRNQRLREEAKRIHGYTCSICNFNFAEKYGDYGNNYIHIHHINPLYFSGETEVDPKTDLIPVCPNCHCMIHRYPDIIITPEELKRKIKK